MSDESDGAPAAEDSTPRSSSPRAKPAAGSPNPRTTNPRTSAARTAKPVSKTAKPGDEERPTAKPARPAASGAAKAAAKSTSTSARTARTPSTPPRTTPPKAATPAAAPATTRKPAATAKALVAKSLTGPTAVVPEVTEAPPVVEAASVVEAAPPVETPEAKPSAVMTSVVASRSIDLEPVLVLEALTKEYGDHLAVDDVTLSLDPGTFTGIVGPNGAGKTTTLSMITGLLRPTRGRVLVAGIDVWRHPQRAKRQLGVLPDRLHTFDRLTGGQLLYYTGVLHGLDRKTARRRTHELADAFKVEHAMGRLVTDYSSGMLKKIALAAALIHAPRLLVLDEPFESVDPVSAMTVAQILKDFAAAGGTVLLSSHSMELVQRICDHVAVIVEGRLIAGGTVDEVRGDRSLQERFIDLAGADAESIADLTWLHRFSG